MKKNSINNKLVNDLDILNEIFIILKLTSKYYIKLCKKFNMTQIQFDVLYLLYLDTDNGVNMSTLGDKLEMARSGVTLLVDKMALTGVVKRRPDVDDKRITKIMITEKGNEIMQQIFPNNDIFKESALDFMQQDEKEFLCKLIIKTKEKLEIKVSTL